MSAAVPVRLPVIECVNVEKRFHHYEHRTTTLQEFVIQWLRRNKQPVPAPAFQLHGIDLQVHAGESLALIGANGSGKSTLLRLLAGIYPPTRGRIIRRGTVVPVIELGSTFQPSLTGVENILLYAAALGLGRREVEMKLDGIFAFAGVEEFREVPLKYYSSGMRSRLAFAIAASARADVMLLDEVTAVGDAEFRDRCVEHLQRFQQNGGTLVIVSHDLESVRELCTRAVWMEHGAVRATGPAGDIIGAYEATVHAAA